MNMEQEPTREQLVAAAVQLGTMLAKVGDFYDVTEGLASGYAIGSAGADASKEQEAKVRLAAVNELRLVAGTVTGWVVDDLRELRVPWSEIGDVLEMTKQAVQQRFGKKPE